MSLELIQKLRSASFHYALAHVNLEKECLFYDKENSLYRVAPKGVSSTQQKKVSLPEILRECFAFTKIENPAEVNLLLVKPMMHNLKQIAKKVKALTHCSFLRLLADRIYCLAMYRRFSSTSSLFMEAQEQIKHHALFLLGCRFGFLLFEEAKQRG